MLQEEWPGPGRQPGLPLLLQGQRGQGGGGGRDSKGTDSGEWDPSALNQGTYTAVSAKVEIGKWQAGFAPFPEQQQLSQNKHSQKHETLKPRPRTLAHIYTHIIIHATSKQWLPQLPGCLFLFIYGALHILMLFSYSGSAASVLYLGGEKNQTNKWLLHTVGCPLGTKDKQILSIFQGAVIQSY